MKFHILSLAAPPPGATLNWSAHGARKEKPRRSVVLLGVIELELRRDASNVVRDCFQGQRDLEFTSDAA